MSPLLEFLATLPQFHADRPACRVIHIGTGCVLSSMDDSFSPPAVMLNASWPGQPENEARMLEGLDAINFYMREARTYGAEAASLNRAIATLDHAMGGVSAFSAAVQSRDSFMGVPRNK
ncbi:hypothetical protein [Paraburkholderia caballeronis]|uniref:hypothetical protein n=1 Tax=Paraburkholderia caballeronis TaxID=416943 RepID=UPI0010650E80|nr:hypothetical protein [Paraburkholderia caballeronis]TDV13924.1 hypothetical protein C7408_10994 [Paraburkholderia caballeronis]TDV15438.1 hypothetical protein C7406_11094 [Paraburkholderia caballeronis]TDV24905.1 hypothetical protein C7404_10994 [Paraburkholderia caballeronis]